MTGNALTLNAVAPPVTTHADLLHLFNLGPRSAARATRLPRGLNSVTSPRSTKPTNCQFVKVCGGATPCFGKRPPPRMIEVGGKRHSSSQIVCAGVSRWQPKRCDVVNKNQDKNAEAGMSNRAFNVLTST